MILGFFVSAEQNLSMTRSQKRKVGSCNYKTSYTNDALKSAFNAVCTNLLSIRKAAKQYKIPFGTLRNKVRGQHMGKVGRPFCLTPECEEHILEVIQCLATWKVPLNKNNICFLVKNYPDLRGVMDSVFSNNLPGPDWLNLFTKRHQLTR